MDPALFAHFTHHSIPFATLVAISRVVGNPRNLQGYGALRIPHLLMAK